MDVAPLPTVTGTGTLMATMAAVIADDPTLTAVMGANPAFRASAGDAVTLLWPSRVRASRKMKANGTLKQGGSNVKADTDVRRLLSAITVCALGIKRKSPHSSWDATMTDYVHAVLVQALDLVQGPHSNVVVDTIDIRKWHPDSPLCPKYAAWVSHCASVLAKLMISDIQSSDKKAIKAANMRRYLKRDRYKVFLCKRYTARYGTPPPGYVPSNSKRQSPDRPTLSTNPRPTKRSKR